MRFRVGLSVRDYKNSLARTSINIEEQGSVQDVVSRALSYYSLIEAITDGYSFRGDISTTLFKRGPILPAATSNFDRRLLVLFRKGNQTASFVVPSYNMADLEQSGNRAFYRVAEGSNTYQNTLLQLRTALDGLFDAHGLPYNDGEYAACVLKNPVE